MLLCETVAMCTLLTGPGIYRAVANRRDEYGFTVSAGVASDADRPNQFQSSTSAMSDFIKADMQSLHGVSDVSVRRAGDQYCVSVFLKDFTRNSRRMVYAKELSLVTEFPGLMFDFEVVDASVRATADVALSR